MPFPRFILRFQSPRSSAIGALALGAGAVAGYHLKTQPDPSCPAFEARAGKVVLQPHPKAVETARQRAETGPQLEGNAKTARAHGVEFVRHQTPCENVEKLFKTGFIQAGDVAGKQNFPYESETPSSRVFVQLTHTETETKKPPPILQEPPCTLYLSLKVLENGDYHLSRGWRYGSKHDEQSAVSTDHPKFEKVVEALTQEIPNFVTQNEVVLEDCVDLKEHLYAAALPRDGSKSESNI